MTQQTFDRIMAGLDDALAFARGDTARGKVVGEYCDVDVKALRERLGLSQVEFARQYHLSLRVLQSWEQRDRRPDTTAQTLLHLIGKNPDAVREMLAQ